MQPWQVFNAARKYIGAENVARIFNKEKRSAYNWAQDPTYTEHRCKSPLELLHALFVKMDDTGLGYAARAAIRYLETAVEDDVEVGEVRDTLPTMSEEILADYRAVATLQAAIERRAPIDEVRALKREAVAEIDRTVTKYFAEVQG